MRSGSGADCRDGTPASPSPSRRRSPRRRTDRTGSPPPGHGPARATCTRRCQGPRRPRSLESPGWPARWKTPSRTRPLDPRRSGPQLGETEVEDLDEPVSGDHHALRLEVSVHDLPEGLSLDELHHDVVKAGLFPDLVDRHDVRVVEGRDRSGFLGEAGEPNRVGREPLGKELHRHVAVEILVVGAEDLSHSPDPELARELVTAEPHANRHRYEGPLSIICRALLWRRDDSRGSLDASASSSA